MGKERPLDYVPVYTSIRRHRKTRRFARALGGDQTVRPHWLLIELFLECADEYPSGILPAEVLEVDIADMAGWSGDEHHLVESLMSAGWIEKLPDGSWRLINWDEYGGKVLSRRTSDRDRKRQERSDDTGFPTESGGHPPDKPEYDDCPADIRVTPATSTHSREQRAESREQRERKTKALERSGFDSAAEQHVVGHYLAKYPERVIQADLPANRQLIRKRLEQYKPEDLCAAVDGNALSDFHRQHKHNSIPQIFRQVESIDRFIALARAPPEPVTKRGKELQAALNAPLNLYENEAL